jgi:hypothetical protein
MKDVAKDYPGGEDGLEATRVSLAVHQSVESKRPVDLKDERNKS